MEPRNAEKLASAVESLLHSSRMREEMGKKGRAKVEKEFNISHTPALLRNIF